MDFTKLNRSSVQFDYFSDNYNRFKTDFNKYSNMVIPLPFLTENILLVTNVINGEFIIEGYVDIPTRNTIKGKLSFYRVEEAMRPYLIEDAMVLASDDTNAEDGGLVVILPDNSNTPLVRIIKYEGENILFIASDRFSKIYTTDDATVLGDVISVTYTYKNI